ncbi:hydrogenase expression/formation protein HypE [Niveibacterium sp. 24ML]|uniref:hydrogenase expression/formation protein HypE n=1 Tax=Niveibacterium sp. 24ML TaxID=2985512 RepID=UPI00226EF93C|nr:hydrogenase expression/formation protein HypE [Niveibacterium sp. 24ML]MCX9156629.1 hydrogenase expression/formation protein HypE [Niveibacterium sp. 24ML]
MNGPTCPLPISDYPRVLLAHGGGGRLMQDLLNRHVLPGVSGSVIGETDSAMLGLGRERIAFTTDSYVVRPLFFPGGDIGTLAVCGTVNDLAMVGATPMFLSLSLILEEGFPIADLDRILATIRRTAEAAGVAIVTGDTKVVDRGKGDGVFLNTAGVGLLRDGPPIAPASVRPGDAVIVSGDLGRHGIAVMAAREGIAFETAIESDVACLHRAVASLLDEGIEVHCMRDLTRGGLVSALTEISSGAGLAIEIDEARIPVAAPVEAACEVLGLDPLYIANEGRFALFVPQAQAEAASACLKQHTPCEGAVQIGQVVASQRSGLSLTTRIGVRRPLDLLSGEQLPRIC